MISKNNVHLKDAHKTPQFWLIWWVLCLNVSAGIGVIGMASPMLQEIFAGKLIGHAGRRLQRSSRLSRRRRSRGSRPALPACCRCSTSAAGSSGRRCRTISAARTPITTFFLLGIALYALAPTFADMGSKLLFVLAFGIILSMYGGGFATVPAYLADMFGTQFVGAIHGRLLTAWSTAGIIGPVVVNYIREFQLAAGVPRDQLYNTTMYILCAMLIAGLICNYLIKPVDPKWHMSAEEVAKLQAASAKSECGGAARLVRHRQGRAGRQGRAVLGLRRHPARLGCVEDAGKRRPRSSDRAIADGGTITIVPRRQSMLIGAHDSERCVPSKSFFMRHHFLLASGMPRIKVRVARPRTRRFQ